MQSYKKNLNKKKQNNVSHNPCVCGVRQKNIITKPYHFKCMGLILAQCPRSEDLMAICIK